MGVKFPITLVLSLELHIELDGIQRQITFEGHDLLNEARHAVADWRGAGCSTRDCVAATVCKAMAGVVADEHERNQRIMGPFDPCGAWDAGFRVAMADLALLNWRKGDAVPTADRALSFARKLDDPRLIEQAETARKHFQQVADSSFSAFERRNYGGVTSMLDDLIANETVEGGLFNAHHNTIPADASKRECWVNFVLGAGATRGLEVGFNAGYSAAAFLELTNATLESHDLCRYDYTLRAARLLESRYAHRLAVVCGDSRHTLAQRQHDADFVFIDGEHTFDAASSDLRHAKRLAKPGSTIIVDDCHGGVADAWNAALDAGWLSNRNKGLCWRGMCVGVRLP